MMILISSNFIFHFTSFCVKGSLFDYITDITYFILTSSKSSGSSNIKLAILSILFSTAFIIALRAVE